MLFTVCLQEVFRALDWKQLGIRVNGEYLSNLRFAGDIALLSNSGDQLLSMITDLHRQSRVVGLRINMQKTNVMFKSLGREQRFAIGSEALEVVNEYLYLGQVVTADPIHETEVTRRIRMGWSAFGRHSQIMNGSVPLRDVIYPPPVGMLHLRDVIYPPPVGMLHLRDVVYPPPAPAPSLAPSFRRINRD